MEAQLNAAMHSKNLVIKLQLCLLYADIGQINDTRYHPRL